MNYLAGYPLALLDCVSTLKREIRIAGMFKQAPTPFLRVIVVHELAHLKVRAHDKAFYALCMHMEPAYHQFELDLRLWLTALEREEGRTDWRLSSLTRACGSRRRSTPVRSPH